MRQIIFSTPPISNQGCELKLAKTWDKVLTKKTIPPQIMKSEGWFFWHSAWIVGWYPVGNSKPVCYCERAILSDFCLKSLTVSGVWSGVLGTGTLTWPYYNLVLTLLSLAYLIVTFTTTVCPLALSLFSRVTMSPASHLRGNIKTFRGRHWLIFNRALKVYWNEIMLNRFDSKRNLLPGFHLAANLIICHFQIKLGVVCVIT